MRIGFFTDTYQPQINGITYVIDIMRRNLEDMGHEVFIFAPAVSGYVEDDDHVIRFRALKGFFYDDYLLSMFFPPKEIRRAASYDLDVVQFFTPSQVGLLGCAVAKKYGLPLVAQYSTDLYEYVGHYPSTLPGIMGLLLFVAPFMVKPKNTDFRPFVGALKPQRRLRTWSKSLVRTTSTLLHNRCDAVIALSLKKERQLREWHTQAPIHLIPTGVDRLPTTKGGAKKFRQHWGLESSDEIILFVGRLGSEKNVDMVIKAFRQIAKRREHAKLVLVGSSEYRKTLQELVRKLHLEDKVVFTGALPRQSLGDVYAAANVFVFPSRTDTQGLVLHEAAHAGLPLVITDKTVSEMVISNKTGFFAPNTASGFARTIETVLDLPSDKYKQMSQAAKQQARRYSERTQMKECEALYEKLLPLKRGEEMPIRSPGADQA